MRAAMSGAPILLLALAATLPLPAPTGASGGGGSQICATSDSLTILVVPPENNLRFYAYKPGPPSSCQLRIFPV